jgi:hypothetical protein
MVTAVLTVVLAIALVSHRQPTWAAVTALMLIISLALAGVLALAMSILDDTRRPGTTTAAISREEENDRRGAEHPGVWPQAQQAGPRTAADTVAAASK